MLKCYYGEIMAETFQELVSQIKDRLDIVEVVEKEVILTKKGANYWGLCPFHNEKTASFTVNPQKGIYKCFSCGEGGDALKFIQKTQGLEFYPMIIDLAEKFGLEVPKNFKQSESKDLKSNMLKACQQATEFYREMLLNSKSSEITEMLNYLNKRGINKDIIEKYSLGASPKSFTELYNHLKKDFSDEVLEKAGLILPSKDGKFIDRFRNRIIIPIQNEIGDYVAFGARTLEADQQAKYLNSSDSLIYNKSKVLFGLYTAKDAIKKEDSVILMEGYFDVISAQAHGIENAVASCGTALTPDQIKLLSRYTKSRKIYLSFDTDNAGQKATGRGAEIIKEAFTGLGHIKQFDESYIASSQDKYACEIRVVCPPEGKDPDEFIRTVGADTFKQIIEASPLLIDFQLNNLLKNKNQFKTPLEKNRFVKEIIPILQEINNDIIRSEYVKMVAGALSIDEKALEQEVKRFGTVQTQIARQENSQQITKIVTKNVTVLEKAQKNLLSVFFTTDNHFNFQQISEMIGDTAFTDETLINVKSTIDKSICTVNNVKELIENLYTEYHENPDVQQVLTSLISISETFSNLTPEDFRMVIQENKNKIFQCQRDKEKENLRKLYINAVDNETEALKLQMQLRDRLNKRLNSEKIND